MGFRLKKISTLFFFSIYMLVLSAGSLFAETKELQSQNELTQLGIDLYKKGDWENSIAIFQKVAQIYPESEAAWINYGSFLYQVSLDSKKAGEGQKGWTGLSLMALDALKEAMKLLQQQSSGAKRNMNMGQVSFLMGDIQHYIFNNPKMAFDYFKASKDFWPENPNLIREMEVVKKKVGANYTPRSVNFNKDWSDLPSLPRLDKNYQ